MEGGRTVTVKLWQFVLGCVALPVAGWGISAGVRFFASRRRQLQIGQATQAAQAAQAAPRTTGTQG